jgi:predicted component of type VI protein secretion system
MLKAGKWSDSLILDLVPVCLKSLKDTLDCQLAFLVRDLPTLILIDLPFDSTPHSLELLDRLAEFAERLLSPVITWITPGFLHLDSWDELSKLPYLSHYLEGSVFAKWRSLREKPASRWLMTMCNPFLLRHPYGNGEMTGGIPFREGIHLWGAPPWAFGALCGKSISISGWPNQFSRWHEVFLEDMSIHQVSSGKFLATQAFLTEERLSQFIECGITPLMSIYNEDSVFIPMEISMGNSSMAYQFMLTQISHFFIALKDHTEERYADRNRLVEFLTQEFEQFWLQNGQYRPEHMEIDIEQASDREAFIVRVNIVLPRALLPAHNEIRLEFYW